MSKLSEKEIHILSGELAAACSIIGEVCQALFFAEKTPATQKAILDARDAADKARKALRAIIFIFGKNLIISRTAIILVVVPRLLLRLLSEHASYSKKTELSNVRVVKPDMADLLNALMVHLFAVSMLIPTALT